MIDQIAPAHAQDDPPAGQRGQRGVARREAGQVGDGHHVRDAFGLAEQELSQRVTGAWRGYWRMKWFDPGLARCRRSCDRQNQIVVLLRAARALVLPLVTLAPLPSEMPSRYHPSG